VGAPDIGGRLYRFRGGIPFFDRGGGWDFFHARILNAQLHWLLAVEAFAIIGLDAVF